jgi:hypothetical protein
MGAMTDQKTLNIGALEVTSTEQEHEVCDRAL